MSIQGQPPPRIAQRFLRWFCKPELLEEIEGDIEEDYYYRQQDKGKNYAAFWYCIDVVRFLKPFAVKSFVKTQTFNPMFSINSKLAFRNLAKNKLYSFINITGLAIGIAACLIITQYVLFQLSFDRFHSKSDRIYRVLTTVYQNGEYGNTGLYCGFALAPALLKDVPEIEQAARVHPYYGGAIVQRTGQKGGMRPFFEEEVLFTEPSFFSIFSFELLQGDAHTALSSPNAVVITQKIADKYFGSSHDAIIGQSLRINGGYTNEEFTITGILKDVPANSHLNFDILLPLQKVLQSNQYTQPGADWGWTNFFVYALLNPQVTEQQAEQKIANLMHRYRAEELESSGTREVLSLEPILDVHLQSSIDNEDGEQANKTDMGTIYFLIVIALFILVIAWINFINLSTAKATERGVEVGIKKAMGAIRPQLIAQFLTESFWINLIAVALGLAITYLSLPIVGEVIDLPLELTWNAPVIQILLLTLIVVGPVLAGLYPAFILSAYQSVNALKSQKSGGQKDRFAVRKALVVFQFVVSTLLMAGTFAVSKQLRYMENRDTGFQMDQVLVIKGPRVGVSLENFEAFKNQVKSIATVESFASSRSIPGAGYSFATNARREDTEQSAVKRIDATWIDKGFMETYGMELISGRDFSDAYDSPDEMDRNGVLVSEEALKVFGLGTAEEALEKRLIISGDTSLIRGVVKDHNWKSLHKGYVASAFYYIPATTRYFSLKINSQNTKATLEQIEEKYHEAFPGNPLEFFFMDDFFNRQYEQDQQFASIFNAFAGFAIFAACLGLFGLASYTVVQKAKEIGIRKVLGAGSLQITLLFSKRYMVLILIANLLAVPLAYLAIHKWLQNFAFSIPIRANLFIVPIVILAAIALLTISFQTLKASFSNPVKNLRSE
ncbi:ABC transporter permease [Roseivirga thermotolerans]|uniref:ABC transporter permease n=1 Tax=Roseivirga thermotolerans TaxID=1758176 RepID=UPI00273DB806|nr:ABC transporter permease [Roseivirga thermotolerans]